jgi:hypothetical protein
MGYGPLHETGSDCTNVTTTLRPSELARGLTETRPLTYHKRDPFPMLPLPGGDTERRMVNVCFSQSGVALHDRHAEHFIDGFPLSTPHPALRATFPASAEKGEIRRPLAGRGPG